MRFLFIPIALVSPCFHALAEPPASKVQMDFKQVAVGKMPQGWSIAKTGQGPGCVWKVLEDPSAPNGAKALAQTTAGPTSQFNLCVANEPKLADVDITVSLKAVAGKHDQGGGIVWRFQDPDNYYLVRLNPLEGDFRLFHVLKGKRTMIDQPDKVNAPAGKWHTLRVVHRGKDIDCYLNGDQFFEVEDETISAAGQIGLWTKADAQTYFDKLEVVPAK